MSASPSHPAIREDRPPASPVMYVRESCSFSKRTAVRSADILVRVVRLIIVQQCTKNNVVHCKHSNVSRSPVVRVADVLVPMLRLMTNSLFLTTGDRYVCNTKVVARCYPRPILWQLPRHKRQELNMSHNVGRALTRDT